MGVPQSSFLILNDKRLVHVGKRFHTQKNLFKHSYSKKNLRKHISMNEKRSKKRKGRPQLTIFEKGQIIGWHDEGVSCRKIAKRLKRGDRCIQKFVKTYKNTGTFERKPGSGRKRKTSAREDRYIVMQALKKRRISSGILRTFYNFENTPRILFLDPRLYFLTQG